MLKRSQELAKPSALEGETVKNSVVGRLGLDKSDVVHSDHYIEALVKPVVAVFLRYDQPLTADRIFYWESAVFPSGRDAKGPIVVAPHPSCQEVIRYGALSS